MLDFRFGVRKHESIALNRPEKKRRLVDLGRRKVLQQYCQGASLALLPAGLGFPSFYSFRSPQIAPGLVQSPAEFHVHPQYREPRALDAILKKVQAGFDNFVTEKYQDQIASAFGDWSAQLLESPHKSAALEKVMASNFTGGSPKAAVSQPVRAGSAVAGVEDEVPGRNAARPRSVSRGMAFGDELVFENGHC